MKSTYLLTISLLLLWGFNSEAQKSSPIIKSGSNTVINGNKAPKSTQSGAIVRPNQSVSGSKVQGSEIKQNGASFFISFPDLSADQAIKEVKQNFLLSNDHTFQQFRETTDDLGITHRSFDQYYKGLLVNEGMLLLHGKNGLISNANGQVVAFEEIDVVPTINAEQAKAKAIEFMAAQEYLKTDYEIELLISEDKVAGKQILTYKVRLDASIPLDLSEVFVDAHTGRIVNRIPLIAHADAQGTAQTYYSGNKSITTDSFNGGFRLRESGRGISTYNMQGGTDYNAAVDYTDADNDWLGTPTLTVLAVTGASNSWWYAPIIDPNADLYIKIKDGSNQVVYTSNYVNNTNPPVAFNVNLALTNPPYSFELWDYDAGNSDDFGGSYSITLANGTSNWSGSGNNGFYVVQNSSAAFDAHWGLEKTYDYFLNVHGRDSYDGNGGQIQCFANFGQNFSNGYWNGLFITLGFGNGYTDAPKTTLDWCGHELTHAFTQHTAGLEYVGESGALNESFSDIFATAIEFYSNPLTANWTIFENSLLVSPYYSRSMSNPNSGQIPQPDTYDGQYWENPNCGIPDSQNDFCGVHYNSGVQNFWFYLLCQGGSGTNDINNAYSVSGIGINQAEGIAYRNLTTYMTPNATFWDSYNGSLQAAADLYGVGSTQWNAVNNAWYAVGIGNGTNNNTTYCSGTTYLYNQSGTFSDGSGNLNYLDYADCIWSIQPAGANTVTVTFPQFSTEAGYDSVMVYDGPDETYPLLMTWWGNTLPPAITSTDGALTVRFMSDESIQAPGWTANYTSSGTAYCDGGNLLTAPSGSFNDGSGSNNYGNNQWCYWYIAPPCANSITLSFSQFNTEDGYDGVIVYDGADLNAPQLLNTSGTSIPASVTSSGGEMLVLFLSDFSFGMQGFSANYTSSGSAYCSGVTTMTTDWGELEDGSGGSDYCNNMNCNWLIQPTGATSVTLNFDAFDLEPASIDGQSIYDAVEVYDGSNSNANLLGRFTGANLPPSVTSSGGNMYVKFYSDEAVTASGWSAYYTSTTIDYCTGLTTLTAPSGTFNDGSGGGLYGNNADCQWLIQPPGVSSITLGFTAFDTETNFDGVVVYDGDNMSAPVLNQYTGSSIPSTVTSTGGAMLVQFLSDVAVRQSGWDAYYNSSVTVGIDEIDEASITVLPNPSNGNFSLQLTDISGVVGYKVQDITGRVVLARTFVSSGSHVEDFDINSFANGVYTILVETSGGTTCRRLIKE